MNLQAIKFLLNRRLLGRKSLLAPTAYYDLSMQVMADDVVGRHLYKYGVHDAATTDFLIDFLTFEDGDVVFDIGANIGWYSLIIDRIAAGRQIRIFGFEPDPTNFALYRENLARNRADRVEPGQLAAADVGGTLKLHLYSRRNLGRHSMLAIHDGATVDVDAVRLDDFCVPEGVADSIPRFIKIDVEGFELMVLRGAGETLARCPTVMLEFSPGYMKAASIDPAELLDLMYAAGLAPHTLSAGRLAAVDRSELLATDRQFDLFWLRR